MENTDLATLLSSDVTLIEPSQEQPMTQPPSSSGSKRTSRGKNKPSTIIASTIAHNSPLSQKNESSYTLKGVIEILILLGLNSVSLWEKTLYAIRTGVSDLMNSEVTSLYFHLKLVSNAIGSGVALSGDLSEYKLDYMNEAEREYEELIKYTEPIFEVYSKVRYSIDSVKLLHDLVKKSMNGNKNDDKRADTEEDDVFNLFGLGIGKKCKGNTLISQQVAIRNEETLRRCTTPGEEGRYLLKIEITDCEDLKGITQDRYWTKISKKVVFLVKDDNDPAFEKLNEIFTEQAKRILKIKDTKMTEHDDSEDKPRKRARFSR